jgi:uncharacterized protein YqgC (DUF456 family)
VPGAPRASNARVFVLWSVLAVLCVLGGLAGCILPALPGPPLSYVGFFVVWAARGFEAKTFGNVAPWVLLGLTVAVSVLDFFAPMIGARRYGASKWGVWGSVVGLLLGMVWFPPFGMIAGTFLGALGGELVKGQTTRRSLRAAWGVFVGTMVGIVLKLAVSGTIAWFVFVEVFA